MGYTKRIVCLASSLKHGGLCIAGRAIEEHGFGAWIRPVSARPTQELTYLEYKFDNGESPKLLDTVDVPLLEGTPHMHQSENAMIDPQRRWIKRGRCAFRRMETLAELPACLWCNSGSTSTGKHNCVTPAEAAEFNWSLCLIRVSSVVIEVVRGVRGERAFRAVFEYGGVRYKLSVTDPLIRDAFEPRGLGSYSLQDSGEVFLCVSLSEAFKQDGRCHKLVAAVISDPSKSL